MGLMYIGIDPDVCKSGFAVWYQQEYIELTCLDLSDLCKALTAYHIEYKVMVRLEAGWLIKKRNWHGGGLGAANSVGRNHEIGRQIEKYCVKEGIHYQLVKPCGYTAYTHAMFCAVSGWPITTKTNADSRVAGMLVYGF